jgi:hypothetical protein
MGREWELSRLGMSLIFVAFSAPVAAATAFLIYPIGQGSFSGMPLGLNIQLHVSIPS